MSKLKSLFAAIGVLAILTLLALYSRHLFENGSCETTVVKSMTTQDQSVKATVYRRECGAAAQTRTFVALSDAKVDGTKKGEVILILTGLSEGASTVTLDWQTNRKLQVIYLEGAEVEYSVTKTNGIEIEYVASHL
jgi:hypothetical protein